MAKNILPENVYPTLEEPAGNEDNVAGNERKNADIVAWRDEENRRTEEENFFSNEVPGMKPIRV